MGFQVALKASAYHRESKQSNPSGISEGSRWCHLSQRPPDSSENGSVTLTFGHT